MIFFPHAKVNIGLDVVARRPDGYHDIETVMYPVGGLCDVLEIVPAGKGEFGFGSSGIGLDCAPEDNICVKAYRMVKERYPVPDVRMYLHKVIPAGAGMGGGSSDAAEVIKGLDRLFGLGMDKEEMKDIAGGVGSDVPFFIDNVPQMARGRGEILEPVDIPQLRGMRLMIVKPDVSVPTAKAYAGITPFKPSVPLARRVKLPVGEWKDMVTNAFEAHIIKEYPAICTIKDELYAQGAVYASMTGSGSAVFGIFSGGKQVSVDKFADSFIYQQLIP